MERYITFKFKINYVDLKYINEIKNMSYTPPPGYLIGPTSTYIGEQTESTRCTAAPVPCPPPPCPVILGSDCVFYSGENLPNSGILTQDTLTISLQKLDANSGDISTGLEAIDEGNGIGYRIIGRDPANFGPVGISAMDLGWSDSPSTTRGATGQAALTLGDDNTSAGYTGVTIGYNNEITPDGAYSFLTGYENKSEGFYSVGSGWDNIFNVTSYSSILHGQHNTSSNFYNFGVGSELALSGFGDVAFGGHHILNSFNNAFATGRGNNSTGAQSITSGAALTNTNSWNLALFGSANVPFTGSGSGRASTDQILVVGNGTYSTPTNTAWLPLVPSNAFEIYRGGEVVAPSLTTALIDAEATGKSLVTKEWVVGTGATSIPDNQIAVGTGTGIEGDSKFTFDSVSSILYIGDENVQFGAIGAYGSNSTGGGLYVAFNGATVNSDDISYKVGANNGVFVLEGEQTGTFLSYTSATQQLAFPMYGGGLYTGTPTYSLNVDVSGNIIETAYVDVASGYVPYTGATANVDLNAKTLSNVASFNNLKLSAPDLAIWNNIAIGVDALASNTKSGVVGVGGNALEFNTGSVVIGVGGRSGRNNAGDSCVFIGQFAGHNNVGDSNNSFGYGSSYKNIGDNCQSIGRDTLYNNVGHNIVGIGAESLQNNSGSNNTAIGHRAGTDRILDTANSKISTSVDETLNRIIIPSHNFGLDGTYTNIFYNTLGGGITGLGYPDYFQIKIIDSNTIEAVDKDLRSQGTGDQIFTPLFLYENTTEIGANSIASKSNQITLGDANVTEVVMGNGDIIYPAPAPELIASDDQTAASISNVGKIRYWADANNSYSDMVMQTGASTYAWVNIVQNNW